MKQRILLAIEKARPGSRRLRVTFKKSAIDAVPYLCSMSQCGQVAIGVADAIVLSVVMLSGDWETDRNRTLVVTMADHFDPDAFAGRMSRALENIEVA